SSRDAKRSVLRTSLPSAFFHPLRFHPGSPFVHALITYFESQYVFRHSPQSPVDRSRSSTAMSTPRLCVAYFHPPACPQPSSMYHGRPAGPGLPSAEPSAAAMIVNGAPWKVGFHSVTPLPPPPHAGR